MISELHFIKLFLDRENYRFYRTYLDGNHLEPITVELIKCLDLWYKNNEKGNPTHEDLYLLGIKTLSKEELLPVIKNVRGIENPYSAKEALREFKKLHLYQDLSTAAYEASEGHKGASERFQHIYQELNKLEQAMEHIESPFHELSLKEILQETDRSQGLHWRLKVLQNHLGNLIPGDFGFIVARPETGKTTFLASEASYMLPQLIELGRPMIWFNNEETGSKVRQRIYQAVLGWTDTQLRADEESAERQFKDLTRGMLKFVDRAYLHRTEVESLCEQYKPRVIILDQIDPIKGFKADREDLRLGEIYKWARALTKQHEMSTIAVCQADVSGENKAYLGMDNVANAKTEKQATADYIVGIGKKSDPSYERVRYLSFMKNKLTGKHTRHEVLIKPEIGRYEDL